MINCVLQYKFSLKEYCLLKKTHNFTNKINSFVFIYLVWLIWFFWFFLEMDCQIFLPSDKKETETKELNLCHKLWFYNPKCCRIEIIWIMNSVRSNNLSVKYSKVTKRDLKIWDYVKYSIHLEFRNFCEINILYW